MSAINWLRTEVYNKYLGGLSNSMAGMAVREMAFKVLCSHENGPEPNIALFCTRQEWIYLDFKHTIGPSGNALCREAICYGNQKPAQKTCA